MKTIPDAGQFNHRVRFEQAVRSDDNLGGASVSWQLYGERWASVETLRGDENVNAQARSSEVSKRILLRRDDGIHAGMRCLIDGVIHHIDWVALYDESKAYSECRVHTGGQA